MGKLGKEGKRLHYLVRCLAEAGFSLRGGDLKGDNHKGDQLLEDEKKIVFQILEAIKGGQNEKIISYHL